MQTNKKTTSKKPAHVDIIIEGNKVAYEFMGRKHGPFNTFADAVHSMSKTMGKRAYTTRLQ